MEIEGIITILVMLILSILFTFFPEEAVKKNTKIPISIKKRDSKIKNELMLAYRVFGVFFFILTFIVIIVFIIKS